MRGKELLLPPHGGSGSFLRQKIKKGGGSYEEKYRKERKPGSGCADQARIGAFWFRTSEGNRKFLSGTILGVPVNIFRNESKKNEKSPDYRIVRFMETQEKAKEEDF